MPATLVTTNEMYFPGTIWTYAGVTAPSGWLLCYGQTVSRTTYADLFNALVPSQGTVTITIATPGVISQTGHPFVTGDAVYLTTTGALPTGLSTNTLYYVIKVDANSYNLATSRANAVAGTKIATSGTQSGTHTLFGCPYGLGDGSTTFTIPDARGRVLAGADAMGGTAASRMTLARSQGSYGNLGASGGAESHTLTEAELPSITGSLTMHGQENGTHIYTATGKFTSSTTITNKYQAGHAATTGANSLGPVTFSFGSDTAHNNVQPTLLVNYIIKT